MKDKKTVATTFAAGAAVGATAGAVAGILFAPHKGTVTRAKMKNAVEENKEKAEEKALKFRQKADTAKERGKEQIEELRND